MKGKLCVITGATSGIGRATALALGALGANLILLGRNERAGEAVIRKIRQQDGGGTVEFISADLADQDQVRRAAARIAAQHAAVDVLVNNAGARHDRFQKSPDGIELTFACNHLGHFLLTALLLERLLAAPAACIITVSSGSHGSAMADGRWALEAATYDRRQAYAKSKLANLLFAYELARRLAGTRVVSCAVDPGGVASNFARNNGLLSWGRHLLSHALRRELVFPREAARTIVWLAGALDVSGINGSFFHRMDRIRSSPASYDAGAARSLWASSLAWTGLAQDPATSPLLTGS